MGKTKGNQNRATQNKHPKLSLQMSLMELYCGVRNQFLKVTVSMQWHLQLSLVLPSTINTDLDSITDIVYSTVSPDLQADFPMQPEQRIIQECVSGPFRHTELQLNSCKNLTWMKQNVVSILKSNSLDSNFCKQFSPRQAAAWQISVQVVKACQSYQLLKIKRGADTRQVTSIMDNLNPKQLPGCTEYC